MLRTLWRMLGRPAAFGAVLLTGANLVQAQVTLPSIPQPADAPKHQPTPQAQLQGPTPSSKSQGLGQPIVNPVIPVGAPAQPEDLKSRIERLERQNQELMNALKGIQRSPTSAPLDGGATISPQEVRELVNSYLMEKDAAKKGEEKAKAADGYKVGTDLKMSASWQNGVVIETPNKDFWMRAGFRFQWDNVWFRQSGTNRLAPPAGIGPEIDGDYWRRIRPNFSGGFWEVGEFNVELKLENIQNGTSGLDDVWVGVKGIPGIGSVRVGHMHVPHGLEADMFSSSRPATFFEVYSGNAAFYQGERCASGLMILNSFLNDRVTYQAFIGRPDINDNGTDFANGDTEGIVRLTALPLWQNEGRCFLHVGGSASFRHVKNNVTTGAPGTVTFSTDAELRDRAGGDNGFGNNTNPTLAGFQPSPGNKNAWVSTGGILASDTSVFGLEFLYNNGPFSVQAEYTKAYIDGANVGGRPRGNLGFEGYYIQAGYFLTGETRTYDKKLGRLGGEYIARANTPFWLVRGEDGRFNYGLGAWEVAGRFSRLDLNNGVVFGGVLDQWEAGVNWHLNNNLRIQFMYLHATRDDGPFPGSWMNGFGIRTQLTF